jgi:hypothetical protein
MIVFLLQKQSKLAVKNASAAQAAADAYAQAVTSNLESRRQISVPYFDVCHQETVRNMCIVAAVARANDFTCSALEAKQLALRYGYVGPKSNTVMVAISTTAAGNPCNAAVAVGLPSLSSCENSSGKNLNSAVWGYGSSGSPQDIEPSTWCWGASSKLLLRPKCPCPLPKNSILAWKGGVSKAKSAPKKCAPKFAPPKKCAPKCAPPKKCAVPKSLKSGQAFVPIFSVPLKFSSSHTPVKRARDSVSLLDILGALSGGLWRVSDPIVKMFIDNFCKSASKALVSDAAVTIAIISILRSKFSSFKKGWQVHVNRSKAFARQAVGEDLYTKLKREFKASLL